MMEAGTRAGDCVTEARCTTCRRSLAGRSAYRVGGDDHCLRCALRHRPLLVRSARTALVVGTLLVAINQGTVLASGAFPAELVWKIPLTYLVPFGVATWGAIGSSRHATSGWATRGARGR